MCELSTHTFMLASEIITEFELYNGDTTELSSAEELNLLNKIYHEVAGGHAWLILNKESTGTLSTTVPYVSLPTRFKSVANTTVYDGHDKFIYVNKAPFKVIPFSERRQYEDVSGYAYIDLATSRLYLTAQPTTAYSYSFDYSEYPADLTLSDSPVFPARLHSVFSHLMAVDDDILQRFPKGDSYIGEHKSRAEDLLNRLRSWNFELAN